jgi:hypothetical protein
MANTARYQKHVPTTFRSIFFAEGDIGFIEFKKKKYGLFFVAVQTWTRWVFVTPIPNKKTDSLRLAIQRMLKVSKSCVITYQKK